MAADPTYNELEKRLREADEIIDALRSHEVDAVIGADKIAMLRLRQVEDQLQEQVKISDNRLKEIEAIYQNVPVGLCVLGPDLKFIRVNEHLAKMNGIPVQEHLGRTLRELLPGLADDIEADLRRVIETGKARMNVELTGETPARPGKERHWLEHWLPLYDEKGQVMGINMVIDEITERKQYEKKLHQLNATLEDRVADRTKVAEQRADKLREMALKMTQVKEKERQRLARILHDGLQQLLIGAKFNTSLISKRLTGQGEVEDQLKELNQILDQSIEAARSLSYELSPPILHDQGLLAGLHWLANMRHMKGLNINFQAEDEMPELPQNLKVFLFQAIKEFLINIIKHAGVDSAEVHITSDDEMLYIEVSDRGKGFDSTDLESVGSTNHGLKNIREKLDLMNGRLEIDSEPGRGSRFIIRIPYNKKEDVSNQTEAGREELEIVRRNTGNFIDVISGNTGLIEVLIVDDHQVMRSGLVRLLNEEADINIVGEASNGVEAVDFARSFQPDVIIMDITMPEMDGIEATRRIHAEYPEINIVGLSMHEENEYTTQMKKAGAIDLLNKGGPSDQLFSAIRSVKIN